jgi:hypothetical protein
MGRPMCPPPPPGNIPPDNLHPATLSLQTDEWIESPTYTPPETATLEKRRLRDDKAADFMNDPTNTPTDWHEYIIFGYYEFHDPGRFKRMWRGFDVKTKAVKIYKAKHIFKVYQFYRANDFEVNPLLHAAAERWARPSTSMPKSTYPSSTRREKNPSQKKRSSKIST